MKVTVTRAELFLCFILWIGSFACMQAAEPRVVDIFGRSLNERGLTLVDWEGYLANPLIKFYLLPPDGAALPVSAKLSANGPRLYFDTPGTVGANGPAKSISFSSAGQGVPVSLSIFPDRDGLDEDYTLTIIL